MSDSRSVTILLVLAMLVASSCGETTPSESAPAPPAPRVQGWQALPASPLGPRTEAHAYWTGEQVIVVGGNDAPPCGPGADCAGAIEPLSDGAAFEPASGTWKAISPAPVPVGSSSGALTSGALYLWVPGFEPAPPVRAAFLVYLIAEDRWEELELPPVPDGTQLFLVAVGDKIVAYHPSQERGVRLDLVYDPATRIWNEIPLDPLVGSYDRTIVWTGRELLLSGIDLVQDPNGRRPSVYRAASHDPVTGAWRRLPDSEVVGFNPSWYWADGRLVNPTTGDSNGGQINNWGRTFPHGGILDARTGVWSPLPDQPAALDTYRGLSVGGSDYLVSLDGLVLHVPTMTWQALTKPRPVEETGAATVWAGDRLFIWGGVRSNAQAAALLAEGWTWQP